MYIKAYQGIHAVVKNFEICLLILFLIQIMLWIFSYWKYVNRYWIFDNFRWRKNRKNSNNHVCLHVYTNEKMTYFNIMFPCVPVISSFKIKIKFYANFWYFILLNYIFVYYTTLLDVFLYICFYPFLSLECVFPLELDVRHLKRWNLIAYTLNMTFQMRCFNFDSFHSVPVYVRIRQTLF